MLQKNEHHTIKITDFGKNGEGIGRVEGFTLFVPGSLPGDTIETQIVKLKKTYGYGKLIRIITPSPDRTEPKCPTASNCGPGERCGGCTLQHYAYPAQLAWKTQAVRDHLERIGGLKGIEVAPVVGMEKPYFYRNKAQYPVRKKNGKVIPGFFSSGSHNIVPISDCCILPPVNKEIINIIIDFIDCHHISAYDETAHEGLIRHILIRTSFFTDEIMVCLILNGRTLPHSQKLVDALRQIPGMKSITLNFNQQKTNVILGNEIQLLWGTDYITDKIGGLQFQISPLSFFQVNPIQTEKLYNKVLSLAFDPDSDGTETVIDAYCGIGSISLLLAKKARTVYGVEIVKRAIEDARRNAALNGIQNAEFIAGQAEKVIPQLYQEQGVRANLIVVDPPRKGCDESLLQTILEMKPKKIIYVSCDSATLARDLKILCADQSYHAEKAWPFDLFPMTGHVETVVLLSKQD